MIRLFVEDAKKEQFRIETDQPITIVTGITDEGRPLYIFRGDRDDVSMDNAEESEYAIKYNPLEAHRYPTDTDMVVDADTPQKVEVHEIEDDEPLVDMNALTTPSVKLVELDSGPAIAGPDLTEGVISDNNDVSVNEDDTPTETDDDLPVVGDMSPEVAKSLSDGDLPVPEDVKLPPPATPQNQNQDNAAVARTPKPPRRAVSPPTRRPGGSGRNPKIPPQS